MAKASTHYDRLGVARSAPDEVIRGAYKALAQKNHPDKNINNPEATAVMQAINMAYDILSDPQKKADYDARLSQEEMEEKARTQGNVQRQQPSPSPAPSYSSPSYSSRSSRRAQPQPVPPRSGIGSLLLVVVLIAALFTAFFISGSISVPRLLPTRSAPPTFLLPAARPTAAVKTVTPRETTPRELAICLFAAAKTYDVPASLLLGLLSTEAGAAGKRTPVLTSGYNSYDLGLMQINSFWLPALAQAWKVDNGMALRRLRDDACANISVGAWILQGTLAKSGDLRSAIALYRATAHHTETKTDDEDYMDKVIKLMTLYKSVRSPEDLVGQSDPH